MSHSELGRTVGRTTEIWLKIDLLKPRLQRLPRYTSTWGDNYVPRRNICIWGKILNSLHFGKCVRWTTGKTRCAKVITSVRHTLPLQHYSLYAIYICMYLETRYWTWVKCKRESGYEYDHEHEALSFGNCYLNIVATRRLLRSRDRRWAKGIDIKIKGWWMHIDGYGTTWMYCTNCIRSYISNTKTHCGALLRNKTALPGASTVADGGVE